MIRDRFHDHDGPAEQIELHETAVKQTFLQPNNQLPFVLLKQSIAQYLKNKTVTISILQQNTYTKSTCMSSTALDDGRLSSSIFSDLAEATEKPGVCTFRS